MMTNLSFTIYDFLYSIYQIYRYSTILSSLLPREPFMKIKESFNGCDFRYSMNDSVSLNQVIKLHLSAQCSKIIPDEKYPVEISLLR